MMQPTNVSFISCLLSRYPNLHYSLYPEKLCYFVCSKLSIKGVVETGVTTFLSTVLQVVKIANYREKLQGSKAWFPYDRPDRPDRPSRFEIFRDDSNDWGDW